MIWITREIKIWFYETQGLSIYDSRTVFEHPEGIVPITYRNLTNRVEIYWRGKPSPVGEYDSYFKGNPIKI